MQFVGIRVVCLALTLLLLVLAAGAEDDEDDISYEEFTLYIGDRVEVGDYSVELIEIQSLRDGLAVIRVSSSGGKLDEQRVLVENMANNFDGGSADGGLTVTVTDIFDEISARVRVEYLEKMGPARKRSADKRPTRAVPDLILTKNLDRLSLSVGDQVKVTVTVRNVGTDTAYGIEVFDQPPLPEFVYIAGYPPKIKEQLAPGESDSAIYYMNGVKEGNIEVPAIEVRYSDSKDNVKSNVSQGLTVAVKPARKPNLELRIDPVRPLRYGETVPVNISVTNTGQATAYRVEIRAATRPTDGLEVVSGSLDGTYFEIAAGMVENYSAKIKGVKSGNYTIVFEASYQGSEGMMVKKESLNVAVLEKEYKYLYYLIVIPVALIALRIVRRYREYKY